MTQEPAQEKETFKEKLISWSIAIVLGGVFLFFYIRHDINKELPETYCEELQEAGGDVGPAQRNLAIAYLCGRDTDPDFEQAIYYFRQGADNGDEFSQYVIGRFYLDESSKHYNPEEAVLWLQKSADQGNLLAQKYLAHCYYYGKGVEKDEAKAEELIKKAAPILDEPEEEKTAVD